MVLARGPTTPVITNQEATVLPEDVYLRLTLTWSLCSSLLPRFSWAMCPPQQSCILFLPTWLKHSHSAVHKLISTHSSIRNSPWILTLIHRSNKIKYWISELRTTLAFSRFPFKMQNLVETPMWLPSVAGWERPFAQALPKSREPRTVISQREGVSLMSGADAL